MAKHETGLIRGDHTFEESTNFDGVCEGSAYVADGAVLNLGGTVTGDLIARAGSLVFVRGIVEGNVVNENAHVEITGSVYGEVIDRQGKKTAISAKAFIRGNRP